jgi:hypothetical protein
MDDQMQHVTDARLRSHLNTNQLFQERMCLAIISMDRRFSNVQPRQPAGGPDGGRDIEATFEQRMLAFGAVGFLNDADDSAKKKRQVKKKFADDLGRALRESRKPQVFVFLTNMPLTVSDKEKLFLQATENGFSHCEIFDRERIRNVLDSPDGLAARFQYLGIPLSQAEQSSFFSRWGEDIQSVISTGFQSIQSTLDRVLFLQESAEPMSFLAIRFDLDGEYPAEEIGHFRAFCSMHLKEPKHKILSVLFGSSDIADRMRSEGHEARSDTRPGIKFGIGSAQWETHIELSEGAESSSGDAETEKYVKTSWSTSIGMDSVNGIGISYSKFSLIRFFPILALKDINEASFLPILNNSLAEKVNRIRVFANEYQLLDIVREDFHIDTSDFSPDIPVEFNKYELSDRWVRIRPNGSSAFRFLFSEQTPQRTYSPRNIHDRGRVIGVPRSSLAPP